MNTFFRCRYSVVRYSLVAVSITVACFTAVAQAPKSLWDSFIVISGSLQRDGTAIACRDTEAIPTTNMIGPDTCKVTTFTKGVIRGRPEKLTIQELLDSHLKGELPAGQHAYVVGVGPGFRMAGKPAAVDYAADKFVIYYKLSRARTSK